MDQNMSMMLAPWGLIIGCALMASSGLSLLDIHFFKTKVQTIAAFCGGLLLVGLVEVSIHGRQRRLFFPGTEDRGLQVLCGRRGGFSRGEGQQG